MHHTFTATDLTKQEHYRLLSGSVVPRPIAFITTLSSEDTGVVNAAPFSFFNVVSADPPLVSISIGRKDGRMKDTARNALYNNELVIHVTDKVILEGVNETAANLKPNESELDRTEFHVKPSEIVKTPGIIEAKARFECILHNHIPIENEYGVITNDLLLAKVVCYHVAEDVYDPEKGYLSSEALMPVARLAGHDYAFLSDVFSIKRPE
ncbi:flavin reductase family protein [Alkalicoccobacillus porphyridii]|uniref:Flavin reductase family protein n=1 Tax=Alkalicoccobacillus porphyridii TaxID=2597270 RepID=A0A554A0K1_9BACI|nr:flavin reductase family protein [Alkalicoccobacillus porphyridii]TSB47221.1 flavin reductase family protein [Alkalicoccobacillus porphyridii]